VLAVGGVALVGLVAGLLVWQPWQQSPVAPASVSVASPTATSVTVSWSASKGGETPDDYAVLRDGTQVGSVPASQTTFTDHGLAPGTRHRYTVVAVSGGQRSSPSVTATVRTITPSPVGLADTKSTWTSVTLHWSPSSLGPDPSQYEVYSNGNAIGSVPGSADSYVVTGLTSGASSSYQVVARWGGASSARSAPFTAAALSFPLSGSVPLTVDTLSTPGGGASLSVGEHWNDTWQFSDSCTSSCTLTNDGEFAAPNVAAKSFTMTMHSSGNGYSGSTRAAIAECGSVHVTDTVSISMTPRGATTNGAWSTWAGTMRLTSPYTTSGSSYCPTQSWTFRLSGNG
jgi:hypothetical protein